jgi:hypothetical protein
MVTGIVIMFLGGLALFLVGLFNLRSRPVTPVAGWTCPDEGCPRTFLHARYLTRHIMDVHPDLTPVDVP